MRPAEEQAGASSELCKIKAVTEWNIDTDFSWNAHFSKTKCMTSATLKPVGKGGSGKFLISF